MGDWDYEAVQEKLNTTKEEPTEDVDVDLSSVEEEVEDVDEEEEEAIEEEEEQEKEIETEKKLPVVEGPDEYGLTPAQKAQIHDQILNLVGKDTVLKIKGVEKKAGELLPEEFVTALQKGLRAEQLYQELATSRRQVDTDRALVEKGAHAVQQFLEQQDRGGGKGRDSGFITDIPEYLRPNVEDTDDVKAFKLSQVKMLDEFNAMKRYIVDNETRSTHKTQTDEILKLRESFPQASIDEVLAVKSARPDINSEELMRASHNYYTGDKFIRSAISANPTFKREFEQEIIRNYVASQKKSKQLPGSKPTATRVEKVSGTMTKPSGLFGFDKAEELSRKYLKEVKRLESEG